MGKRNPCKDMLVWHDQLGIGKIRSVKEDGNLWCSFLFYAPDILVEPDYVDIIAIRPANLPDMQSVQHTFRDAFARSPVDPDKRAPDKSGLLVDMETMQGRGRRLRCIIPEDEGDVAVGPCDGGD